MSTTPPPSFGRAGRPRKIDFSDLFLWDTAIELELTGYSLSELMKEDNPAMLALYQDTRRKKKISLERAKAVLPSAMENLGFPWADEFSKALDGKESEVGNLGSWRSYIYGCSKKDGQWPPKLGAIAQHFVDVEEALKEPTKAWVADDLNRCADLLEAAPIMELYLWPGAVDRLRNAATIEQLTGLRGMVMLELMLSLIAAIDAQATVDGLSAKPEFDGLFPDLSAEQLSQPNALFFDWLADYSGAGTELASFIPQINKAAKDFDIDSAKRQLRRWKRGDAFPSLDVLDAMFRKLYGDKAKEKGNPRRKDWGLSWFKATATRRINFLMGIIGPLSRFREPVFPFGFETVHDWRASRYLHWYRYWLPLLKPAD